MKIYQGVEDFPKLDYAIVTSGTFDGVHIGHQEILTRIAEVAREKGGETVLLTFWPHPRLVLDPGNSLRLLTSFEEKGKLLEKYGIQHLVKISFTREFSLLSSEQFIQEVLIDKIQTKKLVIGYDHRFGRNREGSFEHLKENADRYGFEIEEIPRQDIDEIGVSSTKIRQALLRGDVHTAHLYLGHFYEVTGVVVKGDQIGRTIGFPTANLQIHFEHKLIPGDGIYAVQVKHKDQFFQGMLYIGRRPTINGHNRTIEVNIFDFERGNLW